MVATILKEFISGQIQLRGSESLRGNIAEILMIVATLPQPGATRASRPDEFGQ